MNAREEEFLPSPERTATILAASYLFADRARLPQILRREHRNPREASECRQAFASMRDHRRADNASRARGHLARTFAASAWAAGNATLLRAPLEKRSLRTVAGCQRLATNRKLAVR